jgi:hypothetical protein
MAVMSLHNDDPDIGDIEFRYQPEEMTRSMNAGWDVKPIPGMDDPLTVWGGGEGKSWSFTAAFVGETGRTFAERLWKAAQAEPYSASAPLVWKLVMGRRVIPVIVRNLEFTDSFWNTDLQPDLIEAQISLLKWREYSLSATSE